MDAYLLLVGGDFLTEDIRIELPATIGRGREATITIPHPLISRLHCRLDKRQGSIDVLDLGSLNGTYVNHRRVDVSQQLRPGDLLTIGAITFKVVYDEPAESDINSAPRRRDFHATR